MTNIVLGKQKVLLKLISWEDSSFKSCDIYHS